MLIESSAHCRKHLFLQLTGLELHHFFHFLTTFSEYTKLFLCYLKCVPIFFLRNECLVDVLSEFFDDLSIRLLTDDFVHPPHHHIDFIIMVIVRLKFVFKLRYCRHCLAVQLFKLLVLGVLTEVGPKLLALLSRQLCVSFTFNLDHIMWSLLNFTTHSICHLPNGRQLLTDRLLFHFSFIFKVLYLAFKNSLL